MKGGLNGKGRAGMQPNVWTGGGVWRWTRCVQVSWDGKRDESWREGVALRVSREEVMRESIRNGKRLSG